MVEKRIEKGDLVRVDFNNQQFTLIEKGTVIYVPVSEGDNWVIEGEQVHYINEPCTITLLEKECKCDEYMKNSCICSERILG